MLFKHKVDNGLNKFGNSMANLLDVGREIERIPEKFVKGTTKAAVKAPVALAKAGADVGVGVLKEMSGILAYRIRASCHQDHRTAPRYPKGNWGGFA